MSDDILKLPVGDASRRPMQQGTAPRIELEVGRVPPQALEAEKAVLGATLLSREAVSTAIPLLREESFYHPAHRKIWKVIVDLFGRSSPVDVVTVGEELKNREELKTVGGLEYLVSLDRFVTTTAHADQYCRLVNEKAVLRKLIQVGDMIVARAYEQREEAPNQVDHAEEEIFKIATEQLRLRTGFNQMHQLVLQAYSTIEEYRERKVHVTGVPSGFSDLDEMTAGFQKSDLIVIAGRPSMGK